MHDATRWAIEIKADAIYDGGALRLLLGVTSSTLNRARRAGRLKSTRKGQRTFYLGRWVLEWLANDDHGGKPGEASP